MLYYSNGTDDDDDDDDEVQKTENDISINGNN